jgi:thioredoxin-like negative regulator of GroEL
MIKVNEANFSQVTDGPVLFWGPWCLPCNDILDQLEQTDIACVNIDENYNLVCKYKIVLVPTVLMFAGGEVTERFVGLNQISSRFTTAKNVV